MISLADVQIPEWIHKRMGPALPYNVRIEALRILNGEARDKDWRELWTCWELQLGAELAQDFRLMCEITRMERIEAMEKAGAATDTETK